MKKKGYFDIFFTQKIISNLFYLYLIKKKIFIIKGIIVFPIYKIFYTLSLKYSFFEKFILKLWNENKISENINISFGHEEIITKIPDKYIKKGENFLKTIGIQEQDKIILLYVRDQSYLKKTFPNRDYSYHNYRDTNIDNYIDVINLAIKKGYYVFRMGAVVEKKIKLDNKKFIDYSNLYRTDFLDIFLAHRCSFVIGTPAGYDAVPCLSFKKTILTTNGTPVLPLILSQRLKMYYSLKKYYDNTKKKYLSLKEMLELNLVNKNGKDLLKKNVVVEESSSQELKNIFEEFLGIMDKKLTLSKEDFEIKDKFNDIILNYYFKNSDYNIYGNKTLNQNINTNQQKINENVSEIIKNKKKDVLKSKISINFLKSNSYLIE
tara:strand:+ start:1084 stop:2214 length:1131 start_codon:yes stop_codon:yes gene_type:complete